MSELLEKDIQKQILKYLSYTPVFAWRNNSGAGFNKNAGGDSYFIRFGLKGSADILGILPGGRFLAIEVKKPGGVLTDDQKNFLARINAKGGFAFMADNLDTVIEKLQNL